MRIQITLIKSLSSLQFFFRIVRQCCQGKYRFFQCHFMKGQHVATVSQHNAVQWGQIEIDTAKPPISSRRLKGACWALASQVKFIQPFLLSRFRDVAVSLWDRWFRDVSVYVQRSGTPHSAGVLLSSAADLHLIVWPCSKTIFSLLSRHRNWHQIY